MRFLTNVGSALSSLREHWQRSLLSAIGVMVGAVAIILLVSIAKGVQADIAGQVQDIGVNVLVVIPGRVDENSFNPNLAGQSFLTEQDSENLARVPGVLRTAPWSFVGGGASFGAKVSNSLLVATTPAWFAMHQPKLAEGRVFGSQDDTGQVCVIGSVAGRQLFGSGKAVGREILVNKSRFRVVGVTQDRKAEQSLFSMGSIENVIYIPYHTLKRREPSAQTHRIMIQIAPDTEPKRLIRRLDAVLGQHLDRQQFQVLTQEDLLGLVYKLMNILTWLLTGLTSIALFVGGLGVMTVMLMAVNERTREIGILKAVGARSADIFVQFLWESASIGLMGGLMGLAISAVTCAILYASTPIKPLLTLATVLLAFAVCVGTGALFGVGPALRASRKSPVEALRHD